MLIEPWMSGSLTEIDALLRPVVHCFAQTRQDIEKWTEGLTTENLWARPMDLGAVGFHVRHISGSVDRLFTYVRGGMLSDEQLAALKSEMEPGASRESLLIELNATLDRVGEAVQSIDPGTLREARYVGRKRLPVTVAGLLVHIAEHTQRHVGEAIVTAKVVRAMAALDETAPPKPR